MKLKIKFYFIVVKNKMTNIYNPQYYTSISNILFFIILAILFIKLFLKFSLLGGLTDPIIYGVIANMIVVGIIGNLIVVFNRTRIMNMVKEKEGSKFSCEKISSGLSKVNFIVHTLPMIVCIFILLALIKYNKINPFNKLHSIIFITIVIVIWSLVPTKNGNILFNKLNEDYVHTPLAMFMLIPLLIPLLVYLIDK